MKPCPCGSGQPFIKCCKPFITGKRVPDTAEQLMRSRYTAYTRCNVDYIQTTQAETAAENFDAAETKNWMQAVKWQGLVVHSKNQGQAGDDVAQVEFTAKFKFNGKPCKIQENSCFKRINERWFYVGMM